MNASLRETIDDAEPAVSIVVPCRNERDHIESCIRSILAQEPLPGGFEIIVADGMSDDGSRDILTNLAKDERRLRIVDNPARIVSTGLNIAIKLAKGKIILRMDAHTEYAPDYIRQCVAVLKETGANNVGGPWVAKGAGFVSRAIAAAFQSPFGAGGARGHDASYEGEADTVYLGCWTTDVFDRIGLFDEDLVRNQDDEFNFRLKLAGGKIWQSPRIKSWYKPRGSLCALFKQYMQYGYWKVRVIQKHRMPASLRHLVPGMFVLLMLVLPLVALWWSLAGWAWLALMGIYTLGNVAASSLTAARQGWNLFLLLPCVFACYHFGYGLGFLHGIWDLVVLRRRPSRTYTELTRASATQSFQK
jgi:succinoglycan biosynthesis protein ExoA